MGGVVRMESTSNMHCPDFLCSKSKRIMIIRGSVELVARLSEFVEVEQSRRNTRGERFPAIFGKGLLHRDEVCNLTVLPIKEGSESYSLTKFPTFSVAQHTGKLGSQTPHERFQMQSSGWTRQRAGRHKDKDHRILQVNSVDSRPKFGVLLPYVLVMEKAPEQ